MSDAFMCTGLNLLIQSYTEQLLFYRLWLQSKMICCVAHITPESWAVNIAGFFVYFAVVSMVYLVQFLIAFSAS